MEGRSLCRWGKGPEERQLRGQRIEGAGPLSGWSEPWPTDLETRERSQRKGEARCPLPLSMKQAVATHTPENLGTKRWEVEPELKPMSMAPPPKSVRAPGLSPTPSTGLPASLTHVAGPYIVYMLQEIDILEDWTAIKKVGLVLRAVPTASGSGWPCRSRPRHQLRSLQAARVSFLRTWQSSAVPLPSAPVPWHRCQRTASFCPRLPWRRALPVCPPPSCSRAGAERLGEGGEVAGLAGPLTGGHIWALSRECFMLPTPLGTALAQQPLPPGGWHGGGLAKWEVGSQGAFSSLLPRLGQLCPHRRENLMVRTTGVLPPAITSASWASRKGTQREAAAMSDQRPERVWVGGPCGSLGSRSQGRGREALS